MSLANATQIAELGVEAIRSGDASFDLSAVQTCDSSALAVLLAWQREAQASGKPLEVSGVPEDMIALATVYGVKNVLAIGDQ
ncbi:MAG: STAS domain-containing protein [Burkholderiaceae bacterium]